MAKSSKEIFLNNLPEGVILGKDFRPKKGLSLESQGSLWALKTREQMPQTKVDVCVIHKKDKEFLDLPALNQVYENGRSEKRAVAFWVPRYDPVSGAVYTTRWSEPGTTGTKGGKKLINDPDFVAFAGKKYLPDRNIDLSRFPKSWSVSRLIPQKLDGGIEFALRQQDEVSWDYSTHDGVEQDALRSLMVNIFSHADSLKYGGKVINKDYLEYLSGKTEELLRKLGLDSPSGQFRKRLSYLLLKSVRVDSIGRINPMISRTFLRAAYLQATKMEILNCFVRSKSEKVFNLIMIERETTRSQIAESIRLIEKIAGLGKEPGLAILTENYYRNKPYEITDKEITTTVDILRAISRRMLKPIKVQPYLLPARLSERLLTDIKMKKLSDRRRILNTLEYFNMVLNDKEFISAEEYVKKRNPQKTVERLRQVHGLLASLYDDPDNKVYSVFSENL
jgi:hypothetical protein